MGHIDSSYVELIAGAVIDYRHAEAPITAERVQRWIEQFRPEERGVILQETSRLLNSYYFPRERIKRCLARYLSDHLFAASEPSAALARTQFLQIQLRGRIQQALIGIIDEILREQYDLDFGIVGTRDVDTYVYVHDGIYGGNTISVE